MNQNPPENISNDLQPKGSDRRSAGWDIKFAVRNYSTLVVSQVVIAAFSFLSISVVTRYLGTEGYGEIVAIIAAAQIAQVFVSWSAVALSRYGVEDFVLTGSINRTFWARNILLIPNLLALLAFSFIWLPALLGLFRLGEDSSSLILIYFVVSVFWIHFQQALIGAKLPHLQGVLLAFERVLVFGSILAFIYLFTLSVQSAIAAYIWSSVLISLVSVIRLRKVISFKPEYDPVWVRKLFRFSVPLIPFTLIGYFSSQYIDAVFIARLMTKASLGIYSVAFQVNAILMQFPVLAGSLVMPLFVTLLTKKNTNQIRAYISKVLPLTVLVGGIICSIFAFIGGIMIPILLGAELAVTKELLWILTSGTVFVIPGLIGYIPYINTVAKTYVATINAILTAGINLIGNFLLLPIMGLQGVAWATVISFWASFLLLHLFVNRFLGVNNWLVLVMFLPITLGSVVVTITGNTMLGLALVIILSICMAGIFYRSIKDAISFVVANRVMFASSD